MHPTRCYPLLFFRPHVLIFSNILEFPKPSKGRQSLQHQPKQTPGNKNHKLTAGRQSWGWQGNTSVYTCTQVCVCVCLYVSGGMCEGRLSRRRKWSQRKPVHRDLTISKLWDSRILCHQTVTHNEKSHTTSRVYELVSPLAFSFFFFLPYWKLSLTFRVKTPHSFPIIRILTLKERTTGLHASPRKFLTAAWPGCYYEWRDMGQRQKGRLKLTQRHPWPLSQPFGVAKRKSHLLAFSAFWKPLSFWASHLLPFYSSKCHKIHMPISRKSHRKGSISHLSHLATQWRGYHSFFHSLIYSFIIFLLHHT